ncbi:uncharacterized protein LOC119723211 [Patiria miniata]|uniref:C-type lectin n=1 Tax=Patiria miniata TaxID=46514 RepID=A0A913ZF70_PATMI|nr:uncharacterized protein LOC119723211 [Patiria miniata]
MVAVATWWIALTFVISMASAEPCPDDKWVPFDSKCYAAGTMLNKVWYESTWVNARKICTSVGADLIVTNTWAEFDFALSLLLDTGDQWSLTRCSTNRTGLVWTCEDDPSSYDESDLANNVGYWNWSSGHPTGPPYNEDQCILLSRSESPPLSMQEVSCQLASTPFICEMEAGRLQTTPLPLTTSTSTLAQTPIVPEGPPKQHRVSSLGVFFAHRQAIGGLTNVCMKTTYKLSKMPAKQITVCAVLCLQDSRCKSFNYHRGKQICVMFYVDSSEVGSGGFRQVSGCAYYELR